MSSQTLALTDRPGLVRPVLALAFPVLVEQLLAMLIGISDRALTGHFLETEHLAAITLSAYLVWFMHTIITVVSVGATAMVARFVGAREMATAQRVVGQALLLGAVVAAVAVLFWSSFAGDCVRLMQLRGESADLATRYLRVLVPAIPMLMANSVGVACLRGAGDMVAGMAVMTLVNLVNIAVSWSLVLGCGPIPALGWTGVALGTAAGHGVGGIVVLALLARGRAGLQLRLSEIWPDGNLVRRLLRIGIPVGVESLLISGTQLWFLALVNRLGDLAAAAHGVALTIESFAFMPGFAFQMAAMTLAGQFLGARKHRKATQTVVTALAVGGTIMIGMGVIFYWQASVLPMLLVGTDKPAIAHAAAPLLRTVAFGMPPLALVMILNGALRGAGDTRWPLMASFIGFLGIRIPLTYWFAYETFTVPVVDITVAGWGMGVLGAWRAMVGDITFRAVLVSFRFFQGGWKRTQV